MTVKTLDHQESLVFEQYVKKVGNSNGLIIPSATIKSLSIEEGELVQVEIKKIKKKPTFNIDELMANTDFEAQRNDPTLKEWNDMTSEGREIA